MFGLLFLYMLIYLTVISGMVVSRGLILMMTAWVHILTDRETQNVFRRRQSKAELPCVMTDNLNMQQHTQEVVN